MLPCSRLPQYLSLHVSPFLVARAASCRTCSCRSTDALKNIVNILNLCSEPPWNLPISLLTRLDVCFLRHRPSRPKLSTEIPYSRDVELSRDIDVAAAEQAVQVSLVPIHCAGTLAHQSMLPAC